MSYSVLLVVSTRLVILNINSELPASLLAGDISATLAIAMIYNLANGRDPTAVAGLGWDISIQYIVRALVLAGAVIFDVQTRKRVS